MRNWIGLFAVCVLVSTAAAQEVKHQETKTEEHSFTVVQTSGQAGGMTTMASPETGMIELISPLGGVGGKTVKDAPFSADAVTESTQMLVDGNRIVHRSESKLFRDSQGRTRREQTLDTLGPWGGQGDAPTLIFIRDPNTNESYTLNPQDRTARKATVMTWVSDDGNTHYKAQAGAVFISGNASKKGEMVEQSVSVVRSGDAGRMAAAVPPPTPDLAVESGGTSKSEDLGDQEIEGVKAHGTRTTVTIPAGKIGNDKDINIVNEEWYSADLQMVVKSMHSDPRTGVTTYSLTTIDRSEPAESLFQVPADYTVVEGKDAGPNSFFFKKTAPPAQK